MYGSFSRRTVAAAFAVAVAGLVVGTVAVAGVDVGLPAGGDDDRRFRVVPPEDSGFGYVSTVTRVPGGPNLRSRSVYQGRVTAADYDADGWPDLLATGGTSPGLFHNDNGTFERVDVASFDRFDGSGSVGATAFVDHDGDGDLELVVGFDPPGDDLRYFRFDYRDGTYVDPTRIAGAPDPGRGSTLAPGDYDGDGCGDLFMANYGNFSGARPEGVNANVVPEPAAERDSGASNLLLSGTCGDGFENVTDRAGIEGTHWSIAASLTDLNDDGLDDIHVGNDFYRDTLYVNRGDGTFERRVMGNATYRNAMSSTVFDYDHDGDRDVFVTNIYVDTPWRRYVSIGPREPWLGGNNMLENDGDGRFTDTADDLGVAKGGWGWDAVAADFDNDGWRDLFHTNDKFGRRELQLDPGEPVAPYYAYPVYFDNDRGEFERRNASRLGLAGVESRTAAALDYDRDGDLDMAVGVERGSTKARSQLLYENLGGDGRAIAVRVAPTDDTVAEGTVVEATAGDETYDRVIDAKESGRVHGTRTAHFGVGDAPTVDLRVRWRDGTVARYDDVPTGRAVRVSPDGVETLARFR